MLLTVAARHMRQLRPGLGRASPVILGKAIFFSENEIKFVSPYMSAIIRGECLAHYINPTGVVKTMIVRHWVRASGTLRVTSRHWLLRAGFGISFFLKGLGLTL